MRIAFCTDGGIAAFPGLRRPVAFDVDALPPPEQARFAALVTQARFFSRAAEVQAAPMPDARTYSIEINDGSQHRTLHLREPVGDPALNALVQAIRARIATLRA